MWAARLDLGQHHAVVGTAEVAVGDEPLREQRWAMLMIALYRCGRQADALRAYQRLRAALGADLGIEPSPGLTRLDTAILCQDPMLDGAPVRQLLAPARPAVSAAAHRRSAANVASLPPSRDRLIGRERDLAELSVLTSAARLVTLVGVGGVGKTRLAIETARLIADRFRTTVFVDLSAVTDPAQVVTATVTALQVPIPPGVSPAQALIASAGGAATLLVIDNAEHVVDAVAGLVELILDRCQAWRVVVTSRQALRVRGEHVRPVEPLDAVSTAVDLFHDRLGRSADHDQVVELCRRLDGLPLAIELAAATCRSVGIDDVVRDLDARLDVLLDRRPSDGRHTSLRATIEWSHDLLTTAERQLLRRLSVFAGSFDADAVDVVCGPLDSTTSIAGVLASLVDKSLAVFDHDHGRHRLLETVRRFAAERLDAGEQATYREAHARWYLDALCARPWVDVTTLHPFVPDAANLIAAADWWTAQRRHREVVVLLSRSAGVWVGVMQEGDVAARALAAYEQCRDRLTPCEEAIACAFFGAALHPARRWRRRGVDVDPQLACRQARSNAVALALADADDRPAAAIDAIAELRALPGGLDPDMRVLACVAEAQACCRLDDVEGAEAVYAALIDDRSSMFWCGPMLALAAIRALRADVAGAEQLIALVDQHPNRHLRLGPMTRSSTSPAATSSPPPRGCAVSRRSATSTAPATGRSTTSGSRPPHPLPRPVAISAMPHSSPTPPISRSATASPAPSSPGRSTGDTSRTRPGAPGSTTRSPLTRPGALPTVSCGDAAAQPRRRCASRTSARTSDSSAPAAISSPMRASSCSARASSKTSIDVFAVTALTAMRTTAASVIAAPNVITRPLLLLTIDVTMIPAMPATNTAAHPREIHRFATGVILPGDEL
ncbi:MAG: BTAD domain-containing putative transcriptional regulator [Ilumatobacteraceae bacterium]